MYTRHFKVPNLSPGLAPQTSSFQQCLSPNLVDDNFIPLAVQFKNLGVTFSPHFCSYPTFTLAPCWSILNKVFKSDPFKTSVRLYQLLCLKSFNDFHILFRVKAKILLLLTKALWELYSPTLASPATLAPLKGLPELYWPCATLQTCQVFFLRAFILAIPCLRMLEISSLPSHCLNVTLLGRSFATNLFCTIKPRSFPPLPSLGICS